MANSLRILCNSPVALLLITVILPGALPARRIALKDVANSSVAFSLQELSGAKANRENYSTSTASQAPGLLTPAGPVGLHAPGAKLNVRSRAAWPKRPEVLAHAKHLRSSFKFGAISADTHEAHGLERSDDLPEKVAKKKGPLQDLLQASNSTVAGAAFRGRHPEDLLEASHPMLAETDFRRGHPLKQHCEETKVNIEGRDDPCALKHIFFDFDQTIAKVHVFKVIAGWEHTIPPPFALSDRGQISRIEALNAQGPYWSYSEEYGGIIPTGPKSNLSHGGLSGSTSNGTLWTHAVLGGSARIYGLSMLFADLRAQGIGLTIITKGYVGAVRTVLAAEGLLHNFDRVIGHIGRGYGFDDYDLIAENKPSKMEGDASCALTCTKAELIGTILKREGWGPSQAVLVEDDLNEVDSVVRPGICEAVFVKKRQGMTTAEMQELRCLAGIRTPTCSAVVSHTRVPAADPLAEIRDGLQD